MKSIPILMYHAVSEQPAYATRRLAVNPRSLERQLAFLVDEGYTVLTFSELANAFRVRAPLPKRPVVLTFDDGYADFAREAWPLLQRYGCAATLFVATGWLSDAGARAAGAPLDRMLTWTQVRELAASGIEIGAHSHSHPELDQLPNVTLRQELSGSRALLEDGIGAPVRSLAYPYGYASARVRLAAKAAGYHCAAAVKNVRARASDDLFMLPRLTIRAATGHSTFVAAVRGGSCGRIYRRDRMLTAGWATMRYTRRAAKKVVGNA